MKKQLKKNNDISVKSQSEIYGGGFGWGDFGEVLGNIASAADDAGYIRAHKFTYRLKKHY